MGVTVSITNDTDRPIEGHMLMLGGARVLGWNFTLQPQGFPGATFEKENGGLSNGLPYDCVMTVDVDGDGSYDKIKHRFTAQKRTHLRVSEMLRSNRVDLSGGDITLVSSVTCALRKHGFMLYSGKLNIHKDRLAFISDMIKDFEIPMADIITVCKRHNFRVPNSIKVVAMDRADFNAPKEYFFTSFLQRDKAFEQICKVKEGKSKAQFTQASAGYQTLFKLDSSEIILKRFTCRLRINRGDTLSGTMYISPNYVCFKSATVMDKLKGTKIKALEADENGLVLKLSKGERLYSFLRPEWQLAALEQLKVLSEEWNDNALDSDYIPDFKDHKSFYIVSSFKDNLVLELKAGVPVAAGRDMVIGDALVLSERTGKPSQKFVFDKDNRLLSLLSFDKEADFWSNLNQGSSNLTKDKKYEALPEFFDRIDLEIRPKAMASDVCYLATGDDTSHPGIGRGRYEALKGERMRRYIGIERTGGARSHNPGIQRPSIRPGSRIELGAAHNWTGRYKSGKVSLSRPGKTPGPMQEWRMLDEFDSFLHGMLDPLFREMKMIMSALNFGEKFQSFQEETKKKLALRRSKRHTELWSQTGLAQDNKETKEDISEGPLSIWRPNLSANAVFFGDICISAYGLSELNDRDVGWIADLHPKLLPPASYKLVCVKKTRGSTIASSASPKNSVSGSTKRATSLSSVRNTLLGKKETYVYIWQPIPPSSSSEKYHALGCVATTVPEEPIHLSKIYRCIPESLLLDFPSQLEKRGVLAWTGRGIRPGPNDCAEDLVLPPLASPQAKAVIKEKKTTFAMFRNLGVNSFACTEGEIPDNLSFRFGVSGKELEKMVRFVSQDMLKLVQTCASALDHNVVDKKDGSFEVKEFNDSQLASLLEVLTEIAKVMTAEGDIQSKGGGESTDDSEGPVVAATHDQLDLSGTYISLDRTKYAIDGEGFCREGKKGMCDMALAQSRPFAQLKVLPPVKEDTVALVKMTYLDDDHDPFTGDIEDSSLLIKWEDGDEWIRWRRGSGGARNKKQRADLSWMLKHMAKFREILERFAVDGFVPEMRDSITTFWNASTKLQSYYPAKFKEIAASMKNQYLAPPSQKNKAVQLEPPLILDLGAPGVDGGPLKSGWVLREEEGSGIQGALQVSSMYVTCYNLQLASESSRYSDQKVGETKDSKVVAAAVKTQISQAKCVPKKTYGWEDDKIWVNKGVKAMFEVGIESTKAPPKKQKAADEAAKNETEPQRIGLPHRCIRITHSPGASIERRDLPRVRMYQFSIKFYDTGDSDPRSAFVAISGFLMDGTCIEHRIGLCEEHPGHYAVSPPESIKGGIRGKEEKRGFGQFIGKATAVVGNVGAKLFGEKGPRGWIKTDIKRSVGWHTFTFKGRIKKVTYAIDKQNVHESKGIVEAEILSVSGGSTGDKNVLNELKKLGTRREPAVAGYWAGATFQSLKKKESVPFSRSSLRNKIPPAYADFLDTLVDGWKCLSILPDQKKCCEELNSGKGGTLEKMTGKVYSVIGPAIDARIKQCQDEDTRDTLDGHVDIKIVSAEGLNVDPKKKASMFVSVSLPGASAKVTKKTRQVQAAVNTKWNQEMSFTLDESKDMGEAKFAIILAERSRETPVAGASLTVRELIRKLRSHGAKLNLKGGGTLIIDVKHVSKAMEEMQDAFGDDFDIVDDDDDDEVEEDDPDSLSAEEAKKLVKGLDSLLDDVIYMHVAIGEVERGLPAEMAADLIVRILGLYNSRIVALLDEHAKKYKLHTIRALQLVSWVNSYRTRIDYFALHFPTGGHVDLASPPSSPDKGGWWDKAAGLSPAQKMAALRAQAISDTKRLSEVFLQRYVVFRGMQQNAIVERLIRSEESWKVAKETLESWENDGGPRPEDIKTYTPQSLFTLVDGSIETVGTKYRIAGKQLTREVEIQLKCLEHYTIELSILYDRISFKPLFTRNGARMINCDPHDIVNMSEKELGEMKIKTIRLATAGSSSLKSKAGFVEKDHYWLIAQINNFELFSKYANSVRQKLKDRYVMDVDDYKSITNNFNDIVNLFKKQAERCAGLLAALVLQNCDEIFSALFTPEWTKEDSPIMSHLFERIGGGLEAFTADDVMTNEDMAFLVSTQCILRVGLEYLREIGRKNIGDLQRGKFKEGVKRDYKAIISTVDTDMAEEKQKMLMDNLSVILMVDNVLSVPPSEEDVITAIIEFKACLQAQRAFSKEEIREICGHVALARKDLPKKVRHAIDKGLKKGFELEKTNSLQLSEGLQRLQTSLEGDEKKQWELEVAILEGSKLAPKDGDTSDPYVVMTIHDTAGGVLFKAQTPKIPKTLNPRWNHMFTKIPEKVRGNFSRIDFNVWDHDYVGYNDFMGVCSMSRSDILEGIRNAALQNPGMEDSTALFDLKLDTRVDHPNDEVSGQIKIRITHVEKTDNTKINLESVVKLPTVEEVEGGGSEDQKVMLKKVWRGGMLKKKVRSGLFSRWQDRSFEVHQDGHIAWGKANVTALEWKMEEIVKIVAEEDTKKKNKRFEFEIILSKSVLQLRAPDEKVFSVWVKYVREVLAQAKEAKEAVKKAAVNLDDFLA